MSVSGHIDKPYWVIQRVSDGKCSGGYRNYATPKLYESEATAKRYCGIRERVVKVYLVEALGEDVSGGTS